MKKFITTILFVASTLSAQDITTGLVAHFELNGNVLDSSGNGHHGSFAGSSTYVADRFNVASSALSCTDMFPPVTGTGINLTGSSMTIAFWYLKAFDPIDTWALGIGSESASGKSAHIAIDYPNDVRFAFFYNDLDYTAAPPQATSIWYHITATYEAVAGVRRIYIDGYEVISGVAPEGFSGNSDWGFGMNGLTMDDVRIYNRSLSSGEVSALITIPEPSSSASIIGAFSLFLSIKRRKRVK